MCFESEQECQEKQRPEHPHYEVSGRYHCLALRKGKRAHFTVWGWMLKFFETELNTVNQMLPVINSLQEQNFIML